MVQTSFNLSILSSNGVFRGDSYKPVPVGFATDNFQH